MPTKQKVDLTPEEKKAKLESRMSDDLVLVQIAFKQSDEKKRDAILTRLKGKFTPVFIDECVKDGSLKQKDAELLKTLKRVGAVRASGGAGPKHPWRWRIDVPDDSNIGKTLISLETGLAQFEKENRAELKEVTQYYKDNVGVEKVFSTYFAKKVENGKEKGKKK